MFAWGIVIVLVLPDSPITASNFTLAEKQWVVENLKNDMTGVENKHFKLHQLVEAFTDYKMYLFFLIALMQAVVNGGISNFGALIIKGLVSRSVNNPISPVCRSDLLTFGTSQLSRRLCKFHTEPLSQLRFFYASGLIESFRPTIDAS